MKTTIDESAAPARATSAAKPTHLILQAPWGVHPEGKVLPLNDELMAMLKAAGVAWRPASDAERRIGGYPD